MGPSKKHFFCQRNLVTWKNFSQVNEITIKNFWPPTVSFLDFWQKRLTCISEFNYSCPDELSEKKLLFHKISYFHESFRTLGEKFSELCPTLFGRAIKKGNLCVQRYIVTKNKMFQMFQRMVFFIIVYGLWSERFALSKKNNSLGSKNSILCVQRNVLGGNFCIKSSFFVKIYRTLREKFPVSCLSCFWQGFFVIQFYFCRGRYQGKISRKKVFFHCFQTWSKNRLLKQHQDEYENFILRVWWIFFGVNIIFKVIWYNFFMYFEQKIVNFEKNSTDL